MVRETQRASIRGTAVQLSQRQFPELCRTTEDFARALELRRRPELFLANGNGALNACWGRGCRGCANTPVTGTAPGCRHWGQGLVLLASGRYIETEVDLDELVRQGRMLRGFWVGLAQLPRSHPFTVRRLERLHRIGLFRTDLKDARIGI